MRSLVLYYSNTGNTRKVAEALASGLGAEMAEVTCGAYLRWYGPLAMAWDIFTRHAPKIEILVPPGAVYDLVVVGGPVWAAKIAPTDREPAAPPLVAPRSNCVVCDLQGHRREIARRTDGRRDLQKGTSARRCDSGISRDGDSVRRVRNEDLRICFTANAASQRPGERSAGLRLVKKRSYPPGMSTRPKQGNRDLMT